MLSPPPPLRNRFLLQREHRICHRIFSRSHIRPVKSGASSVHVGTTPRKKTSPCVCLGVYRLHILPLHGSGPVYDPGCGQASHTDTFPPLGNNQSTCGYVNRANRSTKSRLFAVLAPHWWNELPTDIRKSLHLTLETKNTSFPIISGLKHRLALQWHWNVIYLWYYLYYYLWYYLWYFCSSTFLKKCYFLDSCCSEFVLVAAVGLESPIWPRLWLIGNQPE